MKKIIPALTIALCLLVLSACSVTGALGDIADQLHSANNAESSDDTLVIDSGAVSDSDADVMPEEDEADYADEDASETDLFDDSGEEPDTLPIETVPDADLAALSLDELVADAEGSNGCLPYITANCDGAAYINDDIDGSFRHLLDEDYANVYYDANKNDRILSILIAENYDGGNSYYTPYNLDLVTGQYLTGGELLSLINIDADTVRSAELAVMSEEFEHMFGTEPTDDMAVFYQEQRNNTLSDANVELERLWLGYGGELYFTARIYSLAGAEFYEYPMSTGLFFG